jgi:hypothetical protein
LLFLALLLVLVEEVAIFLVHCLSIINEVRSKRQQGSQAMRVGLSVPCT